MGLSWQQGPLAPGALGRFLVPGPPPGRMLFAEPLRRRMRVKFGGACIADSKPRAAWQHTALQTVIPHGVDRDLTTDEIAPGKS
jgi:hypothetical protein